MWPSPRPDIIGTTTPHAAASGARMSDVLSPTPPVLCLSTFGPGTSAHRYRVPESVIAAGQGGRLGGRHAVQEDGHEQGRELVVRPGPVGRGAGRTPSISSRDSSCRSRFWRITSTARMGRLPTWRRHVPPRILRGNDRPPPGSAVSRASAVLIAVEESADLPPAPFAADEVRTLAGHLEARRASPRPGRPLLVGPAATRSAAESRLRRLGHVAPAGRHRLVRVRRPGLPRGRPRVPRLRRHPGRRPGGHGPRRRRRASPARLDRGDRPLPPRRPRPERRRTGRPVPDRRERPSR